MSGMQPWYVPPLDNRISPSTGFPDSDHRQSPANRLKRQMQIENYKRWRDDKLREAMRDDAKDQGPVRAADPARG